MQMFNSLHSTVRHTLSGGRGLIPLLSSLKELKETRGNMIIKNNNEYKIMFGMNFIDAHGTLEVTDEKTIKLLLKQPNVEEFIATEDAKKLEQENKELKAKLQANDLEKAKEEADQLGIKYAKNIGLPALLKKIEEAKETEK